MNAKNLNFICLTGVLSVTLLLTSCSQVMPVDHSTAPDGRYDSEFPNQSVSHDLETIAKSLRKINSTVYYKTYVFSKSLKLMASELPSLDFEKNSESILFTNSTAYGTATIIYADTDKIAILTCAHIVTAEDTLISYFIPSGKNAKKIIQTVAVKVRQQYYVNDLPEGNDLQILALDKIHDIVLLGKSFFQTPDAQVFKLPLGKSSDLQWGSFVYLLGFPMGKKMVTRGIVSLVENDFGDEFFVDALFNRGSSGGIILAIRDGAPNFELVGLTKAVSSRTDYVLSPADSLKENYFNPNLSYEDDAHVMIQKNINYGITFTVPAGEIRRFFKVHEKNLKKAGYDFSRFTR